MTVVGLTGGIASGKSTVARMLAARGVPVIDADLVARDVVAFGQPAWRDIKQRFGSAVLHPGGGLDRQALAAIVFADAGARTDLEAITHPRIYDALRERVQAEDPVRPVVVEAALLAETYDQAVARLGMAALIVVDCPREQQVDRLVRERSLTPEEAARRIDAQMDPEPRRRRADHVIDNSGTREALEREVERVWAAVTAGSTGVRAGHRGS